MARHSTIADHASVRGTRLGHYDVMALLGEGGMGQDYRATDTQLAATSEPYGGQP